MNPSFCAMNHPIGSVRGCPLCDPNAPIPAIPGRKAKSAKARSAARLSPRPVSASPAPIARPVATSATRAPVLTALPPALAYTVKPAKFASRCPDCKQPIAVGEIIRVPKTQGNGYSRHDTCYVGANNPAAMRAADAAARDADAARDRMNAALEAARAPAPVAVQTFPKVAAPAWASQDWRGALTAPKSAAPAPAADDEEKTQVDPLRQPLARGDWRGLYERNAAGLISQAEAEQIAATWKGGATA